MKGVLLRMDDMDAARGVNAAVAAVLRGELASRQWTQKDLARAAGMKPVSVQRYLAAKRAITLPNLERMAGALGLSMTEVLTAAKHRADRPPSPGDAVDVSTG